MLEDVAIKMDTSAEGLEIETEIEAASLPFQVPAVAYVSVAFAPGTYPTGTSKGSPSTSAFLFFLFLFIQARVDVISGIPAGTFTNTMKFKVKDVDPASGISDDVGYEDEYQVFFSLQSAYYSFSKH